MDPTSMLPLATVASIVATSNVRNSNVAVTRGTPNHPTYKEMIRNAIATLKERKGSSKRAIAKYIEKTFTHHSLRLVDSPPKGNKIKYGNNKVVESLLSKVVEECERRVLIQHEMVYACFFFIMFSFIINDTFTQVFCSDEHSNNMLDKLQDAIGRGQYQILMLEYQDRVPNILMIGFRQTSKSKSNKK
ncbi:HMG-Y-related protein A [Senna tora]|uniref:HMG-Y-related protein A n=1 Tax=Senna tora TaxID=362788 RepID=A0A834WYE7_9FABA|nr:HMG-Y-related protein A [Senna tora]